jgi:uncharacterized membrane protein
MDINEEEEIRKEFQLDRMILFTDAVFAIILTIMVLDIKLPEGIRDKGETDLVHAFKSIIPKLLAYAISFFLVARFWMGHLKLFRFLKDYDNKLLILNLVFLFSVTLFPFAVSLISGSVKPQLPEFSWAWTIYILVVYSTVYTQSIITWYLLKYKDKLCINTPRLETSLKGKIQRINLILVPCLFLSVLVFSYFNLPFYYAMYTVLAYGFIIGRLTRKYYPDDNKGLLIMQLFRYLKTNRSKKHRL